MSGDELFAWQVMEGGGWGAIAAVVLNTFDASPLVTRSAAVAEHMRPFAMRHAVVTGLPIRLARFTLAEVVDEMRPDDH